MERDKIVVSEEVKIIFYEGEDVRVLRGSIEKEDTDFIYVRRTDKDFRINKKFIIKIEGNNHD